MNVKKICWGLSLLTCFSGFAGCSDDEEGFNENVILRNDFTNTEGEVIDFVLQDQPACLTGIGDSGVSFCYADYVYEYWFDAEAFLWAIIAIFTICFCPIQSYKEYKV